MNESASQSWYYAKGNQQFGPVPHATVRQLLATGELAPTDLVWTTGMAEWAEARTVDSLTPEPVRAPEPPPAQSTPPPVPPPSWGQPPPPPRPGPFGQHPGYPSPFGARSQHGRATGAFVCGLLSLVCSPAGIGLILGIVAMIMASNATSEMARTNNFEGRGLAKAGFILGIIGIVSSTAACGCFGIGGHHHIRF